jgi:hypothetical protein
MEFFHFMQGFLSSGTLGFHCTKNNCPELIALIYLYLYVFSAVLHLYKYLLVQN